MPGTGGATALISRQASPSNRGVAREHRNHETLSSQRILEPAHLRFSSASERQLLHSGAEDSRHPFGQTDDPVGK